MTKSAIMNFVLHRQRLVIEISRRPFIDETEICSGRFQKYEACYFPVCKKRIRNCAGLTFIHVMKMEENHISYYLATLTKL